jgi:hypothetical protein
MDSHFNGFSDHQLVGLHLDTAALLNDSRRVDQFGHANPFP